MPLFNNKRKDFSIQPPKQSIANGAFSVLDSANIDFTYASDILSANLTQTGVVPNTYGNATNVPQFTVDIWGRITGVTLVPITGGTTVLLQTNSINNPDQTKLNLIEGTNMNITDDGAGNITFDATGGGGGVLTLNNGLTLTGTNGQLGGTLVQNTTVDGTTFPITFTSARTTSFATMYVVNTNTGLGLEVISQNYIPIRATTQPSSTNTVVPTLILERYSTGLVSAGLGQSIVMNAQVTSGSRAGSTNLISKLTNVTPGSWVSQFEIEGVNSGVLSRLFALTGPGQLILDKYTTATSFASVSGASVGVLNVDNAGNVFVGAGGGGSGTVTDFIFTDGNGFTGTVSTSTTTPTLSLTIQTASASQDGQLSSADWTTFNGKAPLASPAFTGSPTAPTQLPSDSSTKLATTAFVIQAVERPLNASNLFNYYNFI
jgi:hypothetical protein